MGTNKFRHGIYVTGSIKEVHFTPDPDSVSANPEIHYYIKATSEGKLTTIAQTERGATILPKQRDSGRKKKRIGSRKS